MSSMLGIFMLPPPPPIMPNGLAPVAAVLVLVAPGIPHGLAALLEVFGAGLLVLEGKALLQALAVAEEDAVLVLVDVAGAGAAGVVGFFLLPMTKKSVEPEAVTP